MHAWKTTRSSCQLLINGMIGAWLAGGPYSAGRESIYPQIAHPPLKNRLITTFDFIESDAHSVCTSGDYMTKGHDSGASMNDGDSDLHSGIQGSRGKYRAAVHAQIARTG